MTSRKKLPRHLATGPFRVGDALSSGVGAGRLRGRDLERPFYGVRKAAGTATLPDASLGSFPSVEDATEFAEFVARCRAYALRLKPGQFFSHTTAARLWRVPLPDRAAPDEPLHVSALAPGRAPESRGVIGHQSPGGALTVEVRFGLPIADPASTWVSLGRLLDHDDLVAAGDHFVLDPAVPSYGEFRPYVTIESLRERAAGFRGAGARALRRAIADVRQGAESRTETLLRLLLMRAGLPEPELNVDIFDANGRWLGRADIVFRRWRVITEYDGDGHRTSTKQYERDMTRIEDFVRARYDVVRVRKHGLFVTPEATVARVRAALRAAGWPG